MSRSVCGQRFKLAQLWVLQACCSLDCMLNASKKQFWVELFSSLFFSWKLCIWLLLSVMPPPPTIPHWPLPGFNWILMINAPRRRSFELPAFLTICSAGTNWPTDPAGARGWGVCAGHSRRSRGCWERSRGCRRSKSGGRRQFWREQSHIDVGEE